MELFRGANFAADGVFFLSRTWWAARRGQRREVTVSDLNLTSSRAPIKGSTAYHIWRPEFAQPTQPFLNLAHARCTATLRAPLFSFYDPPPSPPPPPPQNCVLCHLLPTPPIVLPGFPFPSNSCGWLWWHWEQQENARSPAGLLAPRRLRRSSHPRDPMAANARPMFVQCRVSLYKQWGRLSCQVGGVLKKIRAKTHL